MPLPMKHSVAAKIVEHLQAVICHLVDIQRMLNSSPPSAQTNVDSVSPIDDENLHNMDLYQYGEARATGEGDAVVELPDAPTVEVRVPGDVPYYFHKCHLCKTRFQRTSKAPPQCPKCGSRRWKDGLTKWDRRRNPSESDDPT